MFNFHKSVRNLVTAALLGFIFLSFIVAVLPAYQLQGVMPLPNQPKMSDSETAGLHTFISEGCVACHTQQVRSIEMDKVWGSRPSIPSDYFYSKQRLDVWRQSPSLLGSERTGPDLTNIGKRQPGQQWHLLHLYNPRSVVGQSIMPSYSWLFEIKDTADISSEDITVPVGKKYFYHPGKKVVAKEKAIQLVAYLQSLKQTPLPGSPPLDFIPSRKKENKGSTGGGNQDNSLDGAKLYMQNCAACHQQNGEGIPGAFPSLKGSEIVNDPNFETIINIVLQGYDARSEYGQMPPLADQLTDEEITAIINHERSSWGNDAPPISSDNVKSIRATITQ